MKRFHDQQEDSRTFNVHEDIIRTSEYFQDLFAKHPARTQFDLSNESIDPDDFKLYVDWLYYGDIDLSNLNGNVGFLSRISSGPQHELKLDGAIVKRLCALALLGVTLDDASFRDYILTQLRQRTTLQVAEYARLDPRDAARLWTACADNGSKAWIVQWMLSHLPRQELNRLRWDLPDALLESLLLRMKINFHFVLGQEPGQHVWVDDGKRWYARSALCRETVYDSSSENGIWDLQLQDHDAASFRQYIRHVETQAVIFEGYFGNPMAISKVSDLLQPDELCRWIHFLCKLWLIAETLRDAIGKRDIMSALLTIAPTDSALLSWNTVKLINDRTKAESKLRSWLIDTMVSAAGTDNDWILKKSAELDAMLLSQLFAKSMTTLQGKISIPEAKQMRPQLKDIEKYLDE